MISQSSVSSSKVSTHAASMNSMLSSSLKAGITIETLDAIRSAGGFVLMASRDRSRFGGPSPVRVLAAEEAGDRFDDAVDLPGAQLGEHGEREYDISLALGDGKGPYAEPRVAGLAVEWDGVVNPGLDPGGL